MTKEDLIAMARQAGCAKFVHERKGVKVADETNLLVSVAFVDRFASLVAARTREECAARCEKAAKLISDPIVLGDDVHAAGVNVCMNLARIIRAMGERT